MYRLLGTFFYVRVLAMTDMQMLFLWNTGVPFIHAAVTAH